MNREELDKIMALFGFILSAGGQINIAPRDDGRKPSIYIMVGKQIQIISLIALENSFLVTVFHHPEKEFETHDFCKALDVLLEYVRQFGVSR